MKQRRCLGVVLGGLLLLSGSGCSVQQQQEVLGAIGTIIPGSKSSVIGSETSGATAQSETAVASTQTASAPQSDQVRTDAQLVLRTLQRAMSENLSPFQECLDNPPCKLALTDHLIRLQKQAGGTLELPPAYDRYDLKRGKE